MKTDFTVLAILLGIFAIGFLDELREYFFETSPLAVYLFAVSLILCLAILWESKSAAAKERSKSRKRLAEIPSSLLKSDKTAVLLGRDVELGVDIYLPDSVRLKHVHVIGATGSGKTESVILNLLRQDISRGLGAIILDAKGDQSFLAQLNSYVPKEKLKIFDLSSNATLTFDPLKAGDPIESCQRIFSSFTWSEEYYQSRALSALQKMFISYSSLHTRNPRIRDLSRMMESAEVYAESVTAHGYCTKTAAKDYEELSGLRDQLNILCLGHLERALSPKEADIDLENARNGQVLYFRLQSLLSVKLVSVVGRLIINNLNYLAGTEHRSIRAAGEAKLIPTYLDEFASFVCPEFTDLISKARSAGFALHFAHQSLGDLTKVDDSLIDCLTDNSATKIVMRISSPTSAEFFAKTFGTKLYQKVTQRVTNVEKIENAEAQGEGSQREAHQFRASPDLLKTLPTGMGAVLISHGVDTPSGGSSVFKIRFPAISKP